MFCDQNEINLNLKNEAIIQNITFRDVKINLYSNF